MKFKIRHHLDYNNHERHIILDNLNDNDDVLRIIMNNHEENNNNNNNNHDISNSENKVVQVIKAEDDVSRHSSLELSSSFHDDCNRKKIISSCCSSDDDDSYNSSNSGSSCGSSVVSCTKSNSSFGKYADDDNYCNPLDNTIESWIDVDISSTCDDDDDDISETSYCSSSSASSWYDNGCHSNLSPSDHNNDDHKEVVTIICEDSLVVLDQHHHQEQKSLETKNKQQQHDVAMKQPWRTKTTTSNRMIVDDNNVNTNCSVAVAILDDHNDDVEIISKSINVLMERKKRRRRVSFDTNIYVQEYNITVGAYSSVNDTCPLQLTWEHTPIQIIPLKNNVQNQQQLQTKHADDATNERCQSFVAHRLNLRERRQRIATLNNITVHDVYMLEQQMILCQIQDAIHHNHQIMIHSLNFQDNNDTHDHHDSNGHDNTLLSLGQHRCQDVIWHKNNNNLNKNNANTNNKKKNYNKGMIATTKHHNGQDTKYKKICHPNDKNALHPLSSSSSHSH